jgi:arabinan endo-1,5-alpha-L-arabinosidase
MPSNEAVGAGRFSNPLPGVVLGDPFVLRHRGRFYLYGTNDGPPLADGRAIPAFVSDDLLHWTPLGGALEPADQSADHWAPEVLPWNGRFYMVVSFGDVERRGHALWVADADRPEGPFTLRARVSGPAEVFSIDGAWLLDDDGRLYLFRCLDFVADDDPPHGTGIVVQPMRDPLTPAGPPRVVLRAHSPWQVFETERVMPLYGGRRFATWTTIEGPAPVQRRGRYYCGYSGGNYTGDYGTGEAVADAPLGPYRDLRGREGPIFGTTPGLVEGPGHFSVVRPDLLHDWIVLHGRRPGESGRRVWLCPAEWGEHGVSIGALTDQPQPSPPLPSHRLLGVSAAADTLRGWRRNGGTWTVRDGVLHQSDASAAEALAVCEDVAWDDDEWAVEVSVRFAHVPAAGAGLVIMGAGGAPFDVWVRPTDGELHAAGPGRPLPALGAEAFAPERYHALSVYGTAGRAEVRLDGVAVPGGRPLPPPPWGVALGTQHAAAEFDALAISRGGQKPPSRAAAPGV